MAFFPNVSAWVDVVNAHLYFSSEPETMPLAQLVAVHQGYQGSGKPLWVTETGASNYSITTAVQADRIQRGLTAFARSGLIDRVFIYELLDTNKAGWSGLNYTPDSAELHFGVFTYEGSPKPVADVLRAWTRSGP